MTVIQNPAKIIEHIVTKELNQEDVPVIISDDVNEDNSEFNMAFTVHGKQVNSKKLIEGIASNCKLIPYFKDNKLLFQGFSSAPQPELQENDGDVRLYIDQSDIISYKNSRTKAEKVYTKVDVKYHYDYALKEFTESTSTNDRADTAEEYFSDDPFNSGQFYNIENFGLKTEQELLFEAHYIRDSQSAEALQEFLLLWHCNQHNILKVKLPLKYIQLNIGDYVGFNELINGVKLFGEDYSISNFMDNNYVFRNAQQILPVWMVQATNKTLTHIDVDLIQMHNCTPYNIHTENVPPVINNNQLQFYHNEIGDFVNGNDIIITNSINFFTIRLSVEASDDNEDLIINKFDYDLNKIPEGLNALNLTSDLSEDNNWDETTNSKTISLGVRGGDGSFGDDDSSPFGQWLIDWRDDASEGDYIEFPEGFFSVTVRETDTEEAFEDIKDYPSFRVYKDYNPNNTIEVPYNAGWNLISLPLEVENFNYLTLFPDAIDGTLYGFNETYNQKSFLEIGKAYWLRFENNGTQFISGTVPESITISLVEGWNLIGIPGRNPISIYDIIDVNSILETGTLYSFDGTYANITTLEPGKGYWIRTNNSGEIIINAS
tara:strand:+ start:4171 stop:5976 length:1806 start_codon:yes stop_codon:yes gene_type:complete